MTTDLIRFTQWARESPQRQYTALMGMLYDPEGLNASFERQAANKAPGVDGTRKADYADGLPERLVDLSARLRRLGYRSKPVRRVYIPKASGKGRRALGVPSFEDRIVRRKADWSHQRSLISTCIMSWMSGLRSAMRSHAVARPLWCATRMTLWPAFLRRRTLSGSCGN